MIIIIIWILLGITGAVIANSKGRNGCGWFIILLLFGIFGLIWALVLPSNKEELDNRSLKAGAMKKCPMCAELIKREAIKCRFCGEVFKVSNDNGKSKIECNMNYIPNANNPTSNNYVGIVENKNNKVKRCIIIIIFILIVILLLILISYGIQASTISNITSTYSKAEDKTSLKPKTTLINVDLANAIIKYHIPTEFFKEQNMIGEYSNFRNKKGILEGIYINITCNSKTNINLKENLRKKKFDNYERLTWFSKTINKIHWLGYSIELLNKNLLAKKYNKPIFSCVTIASKHFKVEVLSNDNVQINKLYSIAESIISSYTYNPSSDTKYSLIEAHELLDKGDISPIPSKITEIQKEIIKKFINKYIEYKTNKQLLEKVDLFVKNCLANTDNFNAQSFNKFEQQLSKERDITIKFPDIFSTNKEGLNDYLPYTLSVIGLPKDREVLSRQFMLSLLKDYINTDNTIYKEGILNWLDAATNKHSINPNSITSAKYISDKLISKLTKQYNIN